mgnify:FL=1
MPKGFWIVRGDVFNFEEYSKYIKLASKIINKFNGKFLVRGGPQTEFEQQGYSRTVVIEFNSYQEALDCYQSDDYQKALNIVKISAKRLVVISEGLSSKD